MINPTLNSSLEIVEVKPGFKISLQVLKEMLTDVETTLFFGKVYDLTYAQLSALLSKLFQTTLVNELFNGDHSTELQGYVLSMEDAINAASMMAHGDIVFSPKVPHGEILPHVWEQMQVEVASSIKEVAAKLQTVVGLMPGKQGQMMLMSMMKLNVRRPTLGDHRAVIHHAPQLPNLVVLDVSGSMTRTTIATIVGDVVAMSYLANANLAIVSNTCTFWEPGQYDVASILDRAEFGGTRYETLAPLFDRSKWGTVVTVADYDSSYGAKEHLAGSNGSIESVLDISLVNRPTFLAECLGQLAKEVRPLLIGNSDRVMRA